ncbi:hypothetical protein HFO56_02985 [Rhizobium laguerreae]|uniref:hypothetical protein n=1 Tax=Rhizobium laguerreae TaxID=1076926 RepID=UPI001C92B2A8|nr:hypothetical protein [Rhizobium laguerreae]MBY3151352.1 hypothetical protein [Rhizobium laguerreae]
MSSFSWTLTSGAGTRSARGDLDALTRFVGDADLPGVLAADWIVDLLLADGFENGQAAHHHDVGGESWILMVRPLGDSDRQ